MVYRAAPRDGIAWVSGASSGIGRALSLTLAARGYRVAVTARRAASLTQLAEANPNIFAFPGDVTDRSQMAALAAEIEVSHGPIALAILNAGISLPRERDVAFDPALVSETFDVNVHGTVNCLAPVIAAMRERRSGQIAITASLAGYGGIPGSLAYCASKAALISMAETLRMSLAGDGITVQVINPGFVKSEMTRINDYFEMPFLMDADKAAERICQGLEHGGFEIAFPRRLAWFAKAMRLLPYPVFLPAVKRVSRRAQKHGHE